MQQPKAVPASVDTVPVVVSLVDIPRGVKISSSHLAIRDWPADMVPAGAMTKIEDVVDMVPRSSLVKGEPVINRRIADGLGGLVSSLIPMGMRAFTIRTPTVASGVAGLVQPADNVDIVLTVARVAVGDRTGGGSATTLLQNIEVLAVDQVVDTQSERNEDRNDMRSVTLIVTQDQANKLSLGQSKGTLHLALRRPGDDIDTNTKPVTFNDIRMSSDPMPLPSAPVVKEAPEITATPTRKKPRIRSVTLRGRVFGYVYSNN